MTDMQNDLFPDLMVKTYPSLYSKDAKGKVREFYMVLDADSARYCSMTGLVDGQKVQSGWIYPKTTNIGRSNERRPREQAIFEIEAEYKKKLKTGYFASVEAIGTGSAFFPMLANRYENLKKPLDFIATEYFAQPKLDGIRNMAKPDGCFSRKAEPFPVLKEVYEAFIRVREDFPHYIFDGEMYSHDLADDLPKINTIVKKRTKLMQDDYAAVRALQYHIYDVIDPERPHLVFRERTFILEDLFDRYFTNTHPILKDVETVLVKSQQELDELYEDWRKDNYEGQIIRHGGGLYEPKKRSPFLLKRKEYIDEEFEVVDILEGNGNWAGAAKAAVLKNPKTKDTFEASIAGTYEDNVEVLKNKTEYIGGEATMRYFKISPYGVPVQGVVHAWYPEGRDT